MSEDAIRILSDGGGDSDERPPRRGWVPAVAVVVLVCVGVAWGVGGRGSLDDEAGSAGTAGVFATGSTAAVTTSTIALPTTAWAPSVPATSVPRRAPSVSLEPLDGMAALRGDVALYLLPGPLDDITLWVLRDGRSVVRRDDVPIDPGGRQYPMLITAGRIVFTDPTDGYVIDPDLAETPEALTEASFVIPGATPGLVWYVGKGVEWVAPVDVASLTVGEQIEVADLFWWPVVGIGDGLIVVPIDEETYGRTAYWSPVDGLQPMPLFDTAQSGILAGAGNVAVDASPLGLSILDTESATYLSTFPVDIGEGPVGQVCLFPDQRYVAVVGSTGEAFVGDTSDGAVLATLSGIRDWKGVGWTAHDQLVYVVATEGGTLVRALDVTTEETHDIATLHGFSTWWLAASGSKC